ncbi:MAG: ribbon-helix-helix protein, CopG family [Chloroflexi bacterium CFX6]|nr:ribbon-helix-helix protein, CopG family [Chloroflexi bacterium CFX6]
MTTLAHKPIQVYLRRDQLAALRSLARRRGVSMAEIMRRGVDRMLAETTLDEDPLWELVGVVDDEGPTDMAERHDAYLSGDPEA